MRVSGFAIPKGKVMVQIRQLSYGKAGSNKSLKIILGKKKKMKAKIKVQVIYCLLVTMVITLMQSPAEVKASTLYETCWAEKTTSGVYEYQHLYLVDLSGAVTEYVYNSKGLLVEETNPLGEVTVYAYDALGIRTALNENGIVTEYMTYNGVLLSGYNSEGERIEHYTYGNKILTWE